MGHFLDHLRRRTSATAYIAEIDGLRFLAIAGVMAHHFNSVLTRQRGVAHDAPFVASLLSTGNVGVQLFFVVSGFVLALPFLAAYHAEGPPVGLARYLLRRLTRLEPPYIICLTVLFALRFDALGPKRWRHYWTSLLYLHHAYYGDGGSPVNFVAWSLEIEVQFYLLMPVIAWTLLRWRRLAVRWGLLVLTCAGAIVYQYHRRGGAFPVGFTVVEQWQFFAVGILLADIYLNRWKGRLAEPRWQLDLVATGAFVGIVVATLAWPASGRVLVAALIGVAYAAALHGPLWRRFLANRWIATLGGMCYTIYLYHWWIQTAALELVGGISLRRYSVNLILYGPIVLVSVFAVGGLLFAAFERPFMGVRLSWPSYLRARWPWLTASGTRSEGSPRSGRAS